MPAGLIDSHCHPAVEDPPALREWIARALEAGVHEIIAIGTDTDDWEAYRRLSSAHRGVVHWTAGLHPGHVGEDYLAKLEALRDFLSRKPDPAPCAIGEIGLDFTRLPKDDREERIGWQRDAFARQLRLARSFGLPVVVHSRGTVSECLEGLAGEEFPGEKVVFHCFAEGPESLAAVREYGCRCSFTGLVTFKNAANVREALRLHGLGELMLETDSPYLSPEPFRGKPNHPARTAVVAEFCADLFGTDPDGIAKVTTRNTRRFFGLRPGAD